MGYSYRHMTVHARRIGQYRFITARAQHTQPQWIRVRFEHMQLLWLRCERKHFDNAL